MMHDVESVVTLYAQLDNHPPTEYLPVLVRVPVRVPFEGIGKIATELGAARTFPGELLLDLGVYSHSF